MLICINELYEKASVAICYNEKGKKVLVKEKYYLVVSNIIIPTLLP